MSPEFLNFILALSIIIIAAKFGGYLSTRLNQPSVLGELLAGLLLGPTVLDILHVTWLPFHEDAHLAETLALMAELGVLLLMMLAGLELHLGDLLDSGRVAALAGTLGVLVPLGLGWGAAILFGIDGFAAIFFGLTLAATSVSISAQTLMEMNVLQSRVGLALLGAAVFDDILVILFLSVAFVFASGAGGSLATVGTTILSMVIFLAVAIAFGSVALPRLAHWVNRLPISHGILAFALVMSLFYAWAAEALGGVAAITGAFLVGLFLARTPFQERIEEAIAAMAYGLFVPVFFINIGLEVNMRSIGGSALAFAVILAVLAIISKIGGSGLGALAGGFNRREALQLGIGMVSRGEVGLIVASFALAEGILTPDYFSIVVFVVIVATLVTPPMLRASFAEPAAVPAVTENR